MMPKFGLVVVGVVGFAVGLMCGPEPSRPPAPLVGEVTAARIDQLQYRPLAVSHLTLDGETIPVSTDGPRTGTAVRVNLELGGRPLTVWIQE